jgi:CheY-like chemotaxis protein
LIAVAVAELSGLRVLIVEDEALIALCLEETVCEWGCVVTGSMTTVEDAIECVASTPFDIAILDLSLHGKPVYAVAEAVVKIGKMIVFASASAQSNVPAAFRHFPSILKPYTDEQLLTALIESATRLKHMRAT